MKKLIYAIFFLTCTLLPDDADGQETRFNIGYGFAVPACPSVLRDEFAAGKLDDAHTFYRALPARMATGSTISASVERMMTRNIGAAFGFSYQIGTRKIYWMFPDVAYYQEGNTESGYYSEGRAATRTTTILFTPSIVYHFNGQSVRPFVKAGFLAGLVRSASQTLEYNRPEFFSTSSIECRSTEQSAGSVLGATIALGVQINLVRNVQLFSELGYSRMAYYPGREQSPSFSFDGEEISGMNSHMSTSRGSVSEQLKAGGATTMSLQIGLTFRLRR